MKIDEEYDYNNFYNIRIDSNVYQNSESQSEITFRILVFSKSKKMLFH